MCVHVYVLVLYHAPTMYYIFFAFTCLLLYYASKASPGYSKVFEWSHAVWSSHALESSFCQLKTTSQLVGADYIQ